MKKQNEGFSALLRTEKRWGRFALSGGLNSVDNGSRLSAIVDRKEGKNENV